MSLNKIKNISSKGFTLVELIVVITILAILGTIAFVNYSTFTWEARNAKRASDLNTLKDKIESKVALNSNDLSIFVKAGTPIDNISISGYASWVLHSWSITWTANDVTKAKAYAAWFLNYDALWVKLENFDDSLNTNTNQDKKWYALWTSSYWGSFYEIWATLEKEDWKIALVVWNYRPRNSTSVIKSDNTWTWECSLVAWGLQIVFNEVADIGKFRSWDLVEFSWSTICGMTTGSTWTVNKSSVNNVTNKAYVVVDLSGLPTTLTSTGIASGSLMLDNAESNGLIPWAKVWDGGNFWDYIVINSQTVLPYWY